MFKKCPRDTVLLDWSKYPIIFPNLWPIHIFWIECAQYNSSRNLYEHQYINADPKTKNLEKDIALIK
jgi:hypothetical protein